MNKLRGHVLDTDKGLQAFNGGLLRARKPSGFSGVYATPGQPHRYRTAGLLSWGRPSANLDSAAQSILGSLQLKKVTRETQRLSHPAFVMAKSFAEAIRVLRRGGNSRSYFLGIEMGTH